jgi:hypothetical protein
LASVYLPLCSRTLSLGLFDLVPSGKVFTTLGSETEDHLSHVFFTHSRIR